MSEPEMSDSQESVLRQSNRLKSNRISVEFAEAVTKYLESIESFFDTYDAEKDFEEFASQLNEWHDEIEAQYQALNELNDNKTPESTQNMYDAFMSEVADSKTKLSQLKEKKIADEELSEVQQQIDQAAAAYEERLAKFNALMERKKQKQVQYVQAKSSSSDATGKSSSTDLDVMEVVDRLSKNLVTSIKSTKRNSPEPAVYKGDPVGFQDWELDFDAFVESEGLQGKEPLRFLKKYTDGEAKRAISGHFITNTEQAYLDARKELKTRFGSRHNVNRALRKKLDEFRKIGSKDTKALREFADMLTHVKSAMGDNPELQSLSHSQENERLASKLPDFMIRSWARKVKDMRHDQFRYPSYAEFVHFVQDQAEVMDEPLLKSLNSSQETRKPRLAPAHHRSFNTDTQTHTDTHNKCRCCSKNHSTTECHTMGRMPKEKKEQFVRENRLCFACLQPGHRSKQCSSKASCRKCQRSHPTSLHIEDWVPKPKPPDSVVLKSTETEGNVKQLVTKATSIVNKKIVSMAVPVYISTDDNPAAEKLVYAILDTQSDTSYITKETAQSMDPPFTNETVTIDTLVSESTESIKKYSNLRIRGYQQKSCTMIDAYEWSKLTGNPELIPNSLTVKQYDHLREHADKLPPPLDIPIGLLIGTDVSEVFEPLETVTSVVKGQPFAQRGTLGWSVIGGTCSGDGRKQVKRTRLVEPDEITMVSQEDFRFLSLMEDGTHRNSQGSLEMPLPFRSRPKLPNNKAQAEKRLQGLMRKLRGDEDFDKEYRKFMDELIEKGHAEEANKEPAQGEVWYIPHFAVKHARKNKIRVVFDCSAKYADTALNDHLLQGPDLTNNMLGILLRFRKENIAVACDVEKMFYNFHVNEGDRDYLRFLWLDEHDNMTEYRMTVHLFGATSSPAVATFGLQKLADDKKEEYPQAAQFIKHNFYVDDGITSMATVPEARNLIQSSRKVCQEGNLRLHKFISNSQTALEELPDSERTVKTVDLLTGQDTIQRTLGLEWKVGADHLTFNSNGFVPQPMTRRGVLSTVSQLYDPLGFLSPYTLKGKQLLQTISKHQVEWDSEVSKDLVGPWTEWLSDLEKLDKVKINRCVKPEGFGHTTRVELHHFSDASADGIGACSYIRLVNSRQQIHTALLMAKSKVVPSKGVNTIPRLELQGAVIATQLSAILRRELDMEINAEHFWSDSEIVLAYLANHKKKFHVFVANRVRAINTATEIEQWHHVNGTDNPADIASRGMSIEQLTQSMWFEGPTFLRHPNLEGRLEKVHRIDLPESDPEVQKQRLTLATTTTAHISNKFMLFGSWRALVRSFAILKRCLRDRKWRHPELTVYDLQQSEAFIIKASQTAAYSTKEKVQMINSLHPRLDSEGMWRIGGRMKAQGPLVIPKNSHLAELLIRHHHAKVHHLGYRSTLSAVREAGYWIISGPAHTKKLLGRCVSCKRLRGQTETQLMGNLPKERTEASPPFTHVGMDCFGPFYVKERRSELKRWGLLVTCLYSRAVHIEVLEDMTTDTLLQALRCFMALRGPIKSIICDNGTNFVGLHNLLEKETAAVAPCLKEYLLENQIEFKFNSPEASHQNGVTERLIRSVRAVLNSIALKHKGHIDTKTLRTTFHEAASIVNDRPLTATIITDQGEQVVTPSRLITMKDKALVAAPPGNFAKELYSKQRWRASQQLAQEFWLAWKSEYLDSLQDRQRWTTVKENVKVGDIVIVKDDSPRSTWKISRVTEVKPGDDGLVRNVTVQVGNRHLDGNGIPIESATVLRRPVQKLVVLLRC